MNLELLGAQHGTKILQILTPGGPSGNPAKNSTKISLYTFSQQYPAVKVYRNLGWWEPDHLSWIAPCATWWKERTNFPKLP